MNRRTATAAAAASGKDFTTTLLVDQTPREVFDAVSNVRGWWSENIEGGTARLNDEFIYQHQDLHFCKLRLVEVVPDRRIVWLVTYNYFKFVRDKSEWTGSKVVFDISRRGARTQLVFTHAGLVPDAECYGVCAPAWTHYLRESLLQLITRGSGAPNPIEKVAAQAAR